MKRLAVVVGLIACLGSCPAYAASGQGARASFNFRNARVQDAIRLIAAQYGLNVVIGQEANGLLTANLTDVTVEQAMATVSDATGCEYTLHDGVLIVNPSGMQSRVFALNYLDPAAAAEAIQKVLGPHGVAQPFSGRTKEGLAHSGARSNALIVTDTSARLAQVARVLSEMDIRPRLIAIEAKLVETTLGKDEKLGVDWQIRATATGAKLPTTFPFPKSQGSGDFTATPNPNNQVGGVGPAFPPGQTFPYAVPENYVFGKLSFEEFTVALDILKQSSTTNLVSAPRITTLDNEEAEIIVGTVVPIARYEHTEQTGVLQISGYDEKKIGVRLLVTPHVGPDSTMILVVNPEISEIVEYRGQFNERPVTSTRSATTQVQVRSGETVMIGGLIRTVDMKIERKVPILGDIPILNMLFKHKTISKQKVDLMIFITPHLLES
ncbi:MAG TPA: secretin N-terminal domain-containing protein [Candidatus Limnocylindrales bacterium]|nr:secretin N-terminal domain-containing protein [Candidatus Limnocylindrales bacterium]